MNYYMGMRCLLVIAEYIILAKTLQTKTKNYKFFLITPILFWGIITLFHFKRADAAYLSELMTVVTVMILVEGSFWEKFVQMLKMYVVVTCLDMCLEQIMELILPNIKERKEILDFSVALTALVLILVFYYMKNKIRIQAGENIRKRWMIFFYISILGMEVSAFLTIGGLNYTSEYVDSRNIQIFAKIITIMATLSIIGLMSIIYYVQDTNKRLKESITTERLLQESQQNYYETLLEKEEETRRFRHDILNHFMCIQALAEKEPEHVADYVQNLQEKMIQIQKKCYQTGNTIVDIITNQYISQLKEQVESVQVEISCKCTEQQGIKQADLCTVYSNLLKNAVEEIARQKEGERYLKVLIVQNPSGMKIEIANSTEGIRDGSLVLQTKKKDTQNHGIGLKNVRDTVERQNGIFEYKYQENLFFVTVMIPFEENR